MQGLTRNFVLIAPYATWMVLMTVLPQTAWAYALRGLATLLVLLISYGLSKKLRHPNAAFHDNFRGEAFRLLIGALVGLLVFFVWVAPEPWLWPSSPLSSPSSFASPSPSSFSSPSPSSFASPSPYSPAVCGWPLTVAKLAASAFVISVAEELFFRKWLVDFAGFGWMLLLFGVEHMRWDLGLGRGCVFIAEGVFAGLAYGILARRYGILSAILAHAVTNFVLGLYVIGWDKWFYW